MTQSKTPGPPPPTSTSRAVYDELVGMLADTKTYPTGSRLPLYSKLSEQFRVSEYAVSSAMRALAQEGRVRINPYGAIVQGVSPAVPRLGSQVRRVYDGLKQLLAEPDTYPPGAKLPTYTQLRLTFGVSPSTVTIAVRHLERQGRVAVSKDGVIVCGENAGSAPATRATRTRVTGSVISSPRLVGDTALRRSARTVYAQLVGMLARGAYPPGSALPGRRTLSQQLGASETAVMAALEVLEAERLCIRRSSRFIVWGTKGTSTCASLIVQIVRIRIADGTITPDKPFTARLQRELGVTPRALRSALAPLVEQGLIVLQPGVGAYVPSPGRTPVARSADAPSAERLREIVLKRIADGTIKPNELFVPGLLSEFGVSMYRLTTALAPLIERGDLARRPSVGVYVPSADGLFRTPTAMRLDAIVRERIANNIIKPGEFVAVALMKEFGVTTTVVSQALAPLLSEGLLIYQRNRGTYRPHAPR
ncbi:GntR family transcriptional regulator [Streptomyces sp. NPDC057509]|uniref:GntR family transcriptional regulator n=1 Tax=Streptomyces sp. NPDC057509 TaxID=3346152 RepID=UPI0036A5F948